MKIFKNCWDIFENFKFPIAGWIILIHEVLERFSFYGMKGILSIYLNLYLGFNDDITTILYHLFVGLSYLSPIVGAIVADNYLGRFHTVIVIGLIYMLGHILMTLTSISKNIPGPLIGMCVLSLGAGGIKSSVAAFGGDQIPTGNDKMIEKYFSFFYTAINLGAFIAQFVTPILRKDISCVDGQCYPLGFGVPAAAFILTYIIFIAGKSQYNIVPRSKSVLSKFVCCIYSGITGYFKERKYKKYKSVIDYAYPEYDVDFIEDCKKALKIIVVFLPIPVFWALYDQQGSRWTLQAKYMNGKIGDTYVMKPEQIQAFNALLIIALIPVFDFLIYPFCEKFKVLIKPTSRLVSSYVVAAVSFVLAGILQIYLVQGQNMDFDSGNSLVMFTNIVDNCNLSEINNNWNIKFGKSFCLTTNSGLHNFTLKCNGYDARWENITLPKHQMKSVIITLNNQTRSTNLVSYDVKKSDGQTYIRFLTDEVEYENSSITLVQGFINITVNKDYSLVNPGIYKIYLKSQREGIKMLKSIELFPGQIGSYFANSHIKMFISEFEPKLIHMLWQMPQYIVITCAEILCSITSLSFAYSESPDSMRSLMQAVYLITIFGGNILVVLVAGIGSRISQTTEFFLFSVLVLIAGLINYILIKVFWVSGTGPDNVEMKE